MRKNTGNTRFITGCCLALSVIVLAALLALPGCGTTDEQAEVASLTIDLRAVTLNTGIDIILIPQDSQGFLVQAEGSMDVKVWLQYGKGGDPLYDYIVQEWNGVQVSSSDYTSLKGAIISLLYDEGKTFSNVYGNMEITFTTTDGKTLTATLGDIPISQAYSC